MENKFLFWSYFGQFNSGFAMWESSGREKGQQESTGTQSGAIQGKTGEIKWKL